MPDLEHITRSAIDSGLMVAAVLLAVPVWRKGCWPRPARLYFTVLVAAAVAECWQFVYWNLV